MSDPVKKPTGSLPGMQPESYQPKKPEMMNFLEEAQGQVEKVIDTVVIEGVEFTIIEKGRTLYAGAYAVEPEVKSNTERIEYTSDEEILFEGRQPRDEIKAIRDSVTPDYRIYLNIDYLTAERPCAMLIGLETTSREQPEGIHVIEAEPTLLIKHIFCEGEQAAYE